MKKIVLIAGTEHTRNFLHSQLCEYLGDLATIKSFAIDDGINEKIEADLLVFSSKLVLEEINLNLDKIPYVIATRTINYSKIDKLFYIPEGSEVLFINDVKESTYNCIENLYGLEINHLKYVPYYPGIKDYKHCEIAITPGEVDKVPKDVRTIIDLGSRPFDMGTLIEIMHKLGFYDERVTDISSKYVKKIIELGKKLSVRDNEVMILNKDLERIIVDINSFRSKNENKVAATYRFNNEDQSTELRKDLINKRYFAKYDYVHIKGNSRAILETIKLSKKLSQTDLNILIEGESGTGKELFASAIHNSSKRKSEPYLAVNFSAIPENLIESELFGYEDGAFTGAKKGGKTGYFEQADGGTIFLDEIGDASLTVQARLLRVLQEKEIMRIGGDKLIPLDVRVIAATNKDLTKQISLGNFREDLYYRLRMGYIKIPPLRMRERDAIIIAKDYVEEKTNLTISSDVIKILQKREWKGNIRELLNALEYSIAVCEGKEIKKEHLPIDFFSNSIDNDYIATEDKEEKIKSEILKIIGNYEIKDKLIGRKGICEEMKDKGYIYTEQNIRTILMNFEKEGLITKGRGKRGTHLTDKGNHYINHYINR